MSLSPRNKWLSGVLDHAALHMQAAGRYVIDFEDVLLSLSHDDQLDESPLQDRSRAVKLLEQAGLQVATAKCDLVGTSSKVRLVRELNVLIDGLPSGRGYEQLLFAMLYDAAAKDAMVALGIDLAKLMTSLTFVTVNDSIHRS